MYTYDPSGHRWLENGKQIRKPRNSGHCTLPKGWELEGVDVGHYALTYDGKPVDTVHGATYLVAWKNAHQVIKEVRQGKRTPLRPEDAWIICEGCGSTFYPDEGDCPHCSRIPFDGSPNASYEVAQ